MLKRALIVLPVVGLLGFGLIQAVPAASEEDSPVSLEVFVPSKGGFEKSITVGDNPYGTGSYTVIADRLFDPTTGERAGRTTGICTVVRLMDKVHDGLLQCEHILFLEDGTLTASFGLRFSEAAAGIEPVVAVTGGTGAYSTAGGSGTVESGRMGDAKGDYLRFELFLP